MESTINVSELRRRLLKLLGEGKADLYPFETEKSYPHILQRIVDFWRSPELDAYFENLLTTERNDRQGFPEKVLIELFRLSNLHADYGLSKSAGAWEDSPDPDLSRRL
ncbi:MAG: Ankyrin [Proteobacteria bacterium]|nr:Ankyrin [Pseudomonadota bacterium]